MSEHRQQTKKELASVARTQCSLQQSGGSGIRFAWTIFEVVVKCWRK